MLVLLIVAAVAWVLGTASGTRFALERGLAYYDDLIAGSVSVGAVDGALLDRLEVRDLVLRDAAGVPRVRVGALVLDWVPWALAHGRADVPAVGLSGVRVTLGPDGDAAPLLDLAPPPTDAPPPPPDDAPPSLPLVVDAWVRLHDVAVEQDGGPPLLGPTSLHLAAGGEDTTFRAAIHRLRTALPAQGVRVDRLDLAAGWDGAEATLGWLAVDANLGRVRLRDVAVRPEALAGHLNLNARGDAEALQALLGDALPQPLPADPALQVVAAGAPEGFAVAVGVTLGDAARVRLDLHGALQPAPALDLVVHLDGVQPDALGVDVEGAFAGRARVQVQGPPTPLDRLADIPVDALEVVADVDCPGCALPPIGRFDARVRARLGSGRGEADVALRALGATVDLVAHADDLAEPDTAALDARWSIAVPNVGRPARLGGVRDLKGSLRTRGRCSGRLDALDCAGGLTLRDVAGFGLALDRADIDFEAAPLAAAPRFGVTLDLAGLAPPGLPGRVGGRVTARGTPADVEVTVDVARGADRVDLAARVRPGPPLRVDLRRLDLTALGQRVRALRPATVRLDGGAVAVGGLRLAALGGRIAVDGRFDQAGRSDLTARLIDLDLARARPFAPDDLKPAGTLSLDATFAGSMRAPTLTADLDLRGLALRGARLGDLRLKAKAGGGPATLDLAFTDGPTRAVEIEARAPLRLNLATGAVGPRPAGDHRVQILLRGVDDAWLAPFVKLPEGIGFAVAGRVEAEGRRGAWTALADLKALARAPRVDPVPLTVTLDATPAKQTVALTAEVRPAGSAADPAQVQVDVGTAVDVEALAGGAPLDPKTLPVTLDVRLPGVALATFEPFLPAALFGLEGTLDVEAHADGTVGDPALRGHVRLAKGAVTVVPLGQRLTDLTAEVRLADRRVDIEGVDFRASGGRGNLRGHVALTEGLGLDGELHVIIDGLPVATPGVPPSVLDSRVNVKLARADAAAPLRTDVTVRGTTYRILDLSASGPRPIPHDEDVVYVGARAEEEAQAAAAEADPEAPSAPGPPTIVHVRLAEPVTIIGPILDMQWGGEVTATLGDTVQVEGGLEARRGFIELLGNRFVIDEGQVSLPEGSLIPYVRIVARVETEEAVVTAKISGKATRPTLEFESEPGLPTELVLTLLVTGSTTPNDEDAKTVEEQAASLFASFQAPAVEQAAQRNLGIDRVRLSFGEGGVESPILSFGKHIARWLYVEARYHHNPTDEENETELSATTQLSRRWTLETSYGDRSIGSVDVFWKVPLPRDQPAAAQGLDAVSAPERGDSEPPTGPSPEAGR
ncbi:MAG: translocation/assembly module TamB domain-containing protein [Myxococcales bacterium]|nr:translocation/assembly module TamB domain-containing protein [Myxococcales bacterium]